LNRASTGALATVTGISVTLNARTPVLVPGVSTTFSITISNPGIRNVQVDGLRLDSWGESQQLKTADELLPDTETLVTVDRTTPKNAKLTVPKKSISTTTFSLVNVWMLWATLKSTAPSSK
jgi:hypothetical protein